MVGTRIFLVVCAFLWLPYGVYLFLEPQALVESAGVTATTTTGSTEVRAMYGGLQAAVGLLALLGAVRSGLRRPALVMLVFLAGGLAVARSAGAAMDGGVEAYTVMALALEWAMLAIAVWRLWREGVARANTTAGGVRYLRG